MSSTINNNLVVYTTSPYAQGFAPAVPTIVTNRLIIRPFRNTHSDLLSLALTRFQPAAMTSSTRGTPDTSLEMTREKLQSLVSQFYFAICLKNSNGSEGQMIGDGGVLHYNTKTGWPEFGYKLQQEFWYKGYTTEFASAFMKYWWSIPRNPISLEVIPASMGAYLSTRPLEQVCAWTKVDNIISEKILKRLGFEHIESMNDGHLHYWRLTKEHFDAKPLKE